MATSSGAGAASRMRHARDARRRRPTNGRRLRPGAPTRVARALNHGRLCRQMERVQPATRHRVTIIGGGFGGPLRGAPAGQGRSDRPDARRPAQPPHLPAAALPGRDRRPRPRRDRPARCARSCGKHRNTTVLLGEAVGLDAERREVLLSDGGPIAYDTLIVATGARHAYFGHDEWAALRAGPEVDRRRDGDPAPDPDRLRGRRARARPGASAASG